MVTILVHMKATVLQSGERRRLLRAAVVGGFGSATDQQLRRGTANPIEQPEPEVLPDGELSQHGLGVGQAGIRRG